MLLQVDSVPTNKGLSLGQMLDFHVVEKGLVELNPDISVDALIRRPGDYFSVLQGQRVDYSSTRSGVYYLGKYVCAVDRGFIPEFKLWSTTDGFVEISMVDALSEKWGDTKIAYIQVLPSDPFYNHAVLMADKKDDNYKWENGKLFRFEAFRHTKVKDTVTRVGWRHTFYSLVNYGIPGVTHKTIGAKFGVDMTKYPLGPPEEMLAE